MRPTVSCFAILSYFLYLAPHDLYFLNMPSGHRYSIKIDSDVKYGNDRGSGKWRNILPSSTRNLNTRHRRSRWKSVYRI